MLESGPDYPESTQEMPGDPHPEGGSNAFAEALRESKSVLPIPPVGQRLHATVSKIDGEYVFADYGGRSEAIIETKYLRDEDGSMLVQPGDRIEALVVSNEDSVILAPSLTVPNYESVQRLKDAQRAEIPVAGKVKGINSGGLDVDIAGLRAFCPLSQIELGHCADTSSYVGKSLEFKILEVAEGGRRIVVSRRAMLQQQKEEAARRARESLHVGEEREGTVVRMEPFGAFVDLGGIDGMVHVSEISHDRVRRPSDALAEGDRVRVKVLEIGTDAKGHDRIALSIKAAMQDPWLDIARQIGEGDLLQGTVVRLAEFGAFVRILPGIEGLVHLSELSERRVKQASDVVKEGDEVPVRVLSVDKESRRVSLSLRTGPSRTFDAPAVGVSAEGTIRAHKPYGVFIDLPAFGPRCSGLLPLEETGVGRGGDLQKRFPAGEKIGVVIQQIDEKGRLRLALPSGAARPRAATPPSGSRGVASAMAEALRKALEESRRGGQGAG